VELDTLKNACEKLLKQLSLPESQLNIMLQSPFYKHLQYLKKTDDA
jgi:hypothetical protein